VITISTTSDEEARMMAVLMSRVQAGLDYRLYLFGRSVDPSWACRLPESPGEQPDGVIW